MEHYNEVTSKHLISLIPMKHQRALRMIKTCLSRWPEFFLCSFFPPIYLFFLQPLSINEWFEGPIEHVVLSPLLINKRGDASS